jgi:hypothetical protein
LFIWFQKYVVERIFYYSLSERIISIAKHFNYKIIIGGWLHTGIFSKGTRWTVLVYRTFCIIQNTIICSIFGKERGCECPQFFGYANERWRRPSDSENYDNLAPFLQITTYNTTQFITFAVKSDIFSKNGGMSWLIHFLCQIRPHLWSNFFVPL